MSILHGRDGYDAVAEFTARTRRVLDGDARFRDYELRPIERSHFSDILLDECFGQDVLDVGCGYGKWAALLAPISRSYLGVDVVPDRVTYAETTVPAARFQHIPGPEFYLGRDFDRILFVTVLQHLPLHDALRLLRTAASHCRRGGSLYLREACITNGSLEDAERTYADRPAHMIPKPLSEFRRATPGFVWNRIDDLHFKATRT